MGSITSYKAIPTIIQIGELVIDGYKFNNQFYLSAIGLAGIVNKGHTSFYHLKRGEKNKLGLHPLLRDFDRVAVFGQSGLISLIPMHIAKRYWCYLAKKGNKEAKNLIDEIGEGQVSEFPN